MLSILFFVALLPDAPATACHPDVAPPDPVIVPLPGGYEVSVTASATNGGCSHQPRATTCLMLSKGNQTLAGDCAHLP